MPHLLRTRPSTLVSLFLVIAVGLGLGATSRAAAAEAAGASPTTEMFLSIEGVKGESTEAAHKDWIAVLTFQWGLSRSAGTTAGAGAISGTAKSDDFIITKRVDLSTPKLMDAAARSRPYNTVVLSVCERTPAGLVEYLRFTMSDVVVTSIDIAGDAGSARDTDTTVLTFARISVVYTKPPAWPLTQFNWDFARNTSF